MRVAVSAAGGRFRILLTRLLARLGFREDSFLLLAAILIGMVTAAAAVGFHELIHQIRKILYEQVNPEFLYGPGIVLLIAFPAMGGLAVGLISRSALMKRYQRALAES